MKKIFFLSVLSLFSTFAMSDYVALIGHNNFVTSEENIPVEPCVTRSELDNKIINGEDLTTVNTSCITDFSYLFQLTDFNQDISGWDVSNGVNFSYMFSNANLFNQDLNSWNVSNGLNFSNMFNNAKVFNNNISDWNVEKGNDFNHMFSNAHSFNQDVSSWNTINGVNFYAMFWTAKNFNQNISSWNVVNATNWVNFRVHSGLSTSNTPLRFQ